MRAAEVGSASGTDSECFSLVSSCFCVQLTVLNAGRRYLGSDDLRGRVFLTSGLGGMSGAQAKAAVIAGCVGVIAEVSGYLCHFLFILTAD